jgi:hypothetical protein
MQAGIVSLFTPSLSAATSVAVFFFKNRPYFLKAYAGSLESLPASD